ncbi:hypothetical protein [Sphingomonas sp.]|jgi:hypothetical protein|uniref:hypothetical protein n=1 Tax=Sphingomonas sp. TaxID=28214 RepID=UPI002ED7A652
MPFHLAHADSVADAADLIAHHGNAARESAAARACAARAVGNHLRFCHWRQIERLILLLDTREVIGTVH